MRSSIISAEICLHLKVTTNKVCINKSFDGIILEYDIYIRYNCITEVKNRFTALQEANTNDSYANTRYNFFRNHA